MPVISPAVFDFWASKIDPTLSWERTLARVVERRQEAEGSVTLVLQPNRHFKGFKPGQHVNVGVEVNGARLTRSYSFSDIPRPDGRVSITVRRASEGKVSSELCRNTVVGDVLELGEAFGAMTLPETPAKCLFLAGGSGISPLMGLTRALAAGQARVDLILIYWVRTRAELCFVKELTALSSVVPGVKVHYILTREASPGRSDLSGRPDAAQLAQLVPDLAQRSVYACGSAGFVGSVRSLTADQAALFHAEAFTPPVANDDQDGSVRVYLKASRRTLELPMGVSLLTALEAQGIHPPSGCRMGICNTCSCTKVEGVTADIDTLALNAEPDTSLRICVNGARSDLTLDL